MLIGRINNRSLGLRGQQPMGNRYMSDITVTLLKLHCTVTHAHTHLHVHTQRCVLTLTPLSSGKIQVHLKGGERSREREFGGRRGEQDTTGAIDRGLLYVPKTKSISIKGSKRQKGRAQKVFKKGCHSCH